MIAFTTVFSPVLFMHVLWCHLDEEADMITIKVSSGAMMAALYVVHLYAHNMDEGCIFLCKQIKSIHTGVMS